MAVLRDHAQRHLLGLLSFGSGGHPPLREAGPPDLIGARRRARLEAAAAALVEVGALTKAESAQFSERLEEALANRGGERREVFDERLAGRARALLERRLEAVASGPDLPRMPSELERPPPPDPDHEKAIDRFNQLHSACEACRALPEDELLRWRQRLIEADDGRAWHLERERRRKRSTARELRAVVSGPSTRRAGLRLMTAELYADGVLVRWHETGGSRAGRVADPASRHELERRHVALSDDLGTCYLHLQTSEAHSFAAVVWTASFATPVPACARQLVVEVRGERFVIPLLSHGSGQ